MRIGLGLALVDTRPSGSAAPTLPTTGLLLDYDIADASVVSGGVDSLTPSAGSMAGDANAVLAYQWSRPTYTAEDADFSNKPSASKSNAASALYSGVFAAPISQPSTWYLVARVYAGANAMYWRLKASGSLSGSAGLYTSGAGVTLKATSDTSELTTTISAGVHLIAVVYNGASSAVYIDDMATAAVSGNASSSACESLLTGIFSGEHTDVSYKWARLVAYSGSHDQASREDVQTYLASQYGL